MSVPAGEDHHATDAFPTLGEVRSACDQAGLIGARVRRHVAWLKPPR